MRLPIALAAAWATLACDGAPNVKCNVDGDCPSFAYCDKPKGEEGLCVKRPPVDAGPPLPESLAITAPPAGTLVGASGVVVEATLTNPGPKPPEKLDLLVGGVPVIALSRTGVSGPVVKYGGRYLPVVDAPATLNAVAYRGQPDELMTAGIDVTCDVTAPV